FTGSASRWGESAQDRQAPGEAVVPLGWWPRCFPAIHHPAEPPAPGASQKKGTNPTPWYTLPRSAPARARTPTLSWSVVPVGIASLLWRFTPGVLFIGPCPIHRQDHPCPLLPSVSPRHWPAPSRPLATPSPLRCNSG